LVPLVPYGTEWRQAKTSPAPPKTAASDCCTASKRFSCATDSGASPSPSWPRRCAARAGPYISWPRARRTCSCWCSIACCRIERCGHDAAAAEEDTGNKIAAFIQPGLTELRNATPAFFADIAAHPPAQRLLAQHQDTRERELCKLIERGVRRGECRRVHAEVAAQALLAAYRAITSPAFLSNVDISLTDAVGEGRDLFLYGLLHPED